MEKSLSELFLPSSQPLYHHFTDFTSAIGQPQLSSGGAFHPAAFIHWAKIWKEHQARLSQLSPLLSPPIQHAPLALTTSSGLAPSIPLDVHSSSSNKSRGTKVSAFSPVSPKSAEIFPAFINPLQDSNLMKMRQLLHSASIFRQENASLGRLHGESKEESYSTTTSSREIDDDLKLKNHRDDQGLDLSVKTSSSSPAYHHGHTKISPGSLIEPSDLSRKRSLPQTPECTVRKPGASAPRASKSSGVSKFKAALYTRSYIL